MTNTTKKFSAHGWIGLALTVIFWTLNWGLHGLRTQWAFFPLWLGYCLTVDALVLWRTGTSLLTRNWKKYIGLFLASAPVWWLFELANWRLQNWHYDGAEAFSTLQFWFWATVNFTTVIPAVFGAAELMRSFIRKPVRGPVIRPTKTTTLGFFLAGWIMLALMIAWPKTFFPFVWISLYFILEPINIWLGHRNLVEWTKGGNWRPVVTLWLGVLLTAFFWEMWNYLSYPKWVYHVPWGNWLHLFEMPLLGYGGYLPFALELFAMYHLIIGLFGAKKTDYLIGPEALMLENVLQTQCGLDLQKPILAGVSGGPDSLCLLDVLHAAGVPVIVAHFNHRLRPEADLEAASVSERARSLGLPFVTDSADVRGYAEEQSISLEEAARTLRYRFLFAAARLHGAQAVAVGHTADDQVETVLMHFLRGAGLTGLKGMEYCTLLPVFDADIPLIRPLLSLWRADTESYCRERNLEPHFDASNADTVYFRNRLRHELIPELEKYNPRLKEALLRTAQALQGDYSVLQEMLQDSWQEVVVDTGNGWVAFDRPAMVKFFPALRRNLIRKAAESLRPDSRDFGFEALERAAVFVEAPAGKQVDFVNGLYLFAENRKIYLAAYEADLPFGNWPQISEQLSVNSDQCGLRNGWVLAMEEMPLDTESWRLNADPWSAWLDADLMAGSLTVRPRRAGDVFSPLGMNRQTVKLREFFINVKLPRRARANWPLVCSGDQIVWVPGFRIAHPFRVTETTERVLRLVLHKS